MATAETQSRLVNIESLSGKSLRDVFNTILEHLGYTVASTSITTNEATRTERALATVGLAGDFAPISATMAAEKISGDKTSKAVTETLVVTSPTDSRIISMCEMLEINLIIDELHTASKETARQISAFIKAYANASCSKFKIALLGTSADASKMVDYDQGIDRTLQEIQLTKMTESEAAFIVEKGMESLHIGVDGATVKAIVAASVGSPAVVQYLALEVAEAAFTRNPRVASAADLANALRNYVRLKAKRLKALYFKAIETTGPRRYRKLVLRAMSEIDDEYVTMEALKVQVSKILGEEVQSNNLSMPLKELREAKYGPMIQDVERREGDRVYNYSTFCDPAMKAFIRMYNHGEAAGILPKKENDNNPNEEGDSGSQKA